MMMKNSTEMLICFEILRLLGIKIVPHFHANMKVQNVMCKDDNNSKSRAATFLKFDIYKMI